MIKEKIINLLCKNGYSIVSAAEVATKKIAEIQEFFRQYPKTTTYTFICCNRYITIGRRQ